MNRFLVLFAREPAREAREKGLPSAAAADVFAAFASGWADAAAHAGARLVVAAPAEDLAAWRRRLSANRNVLWLPQRGRSFGERLEDSARSISLRGGRALLVGGDVPPDAAIAVRAFGALDRGAEAVLAPAPDGGVSLLALGDADLDLLAGIAVGQRDVCAILAERLTARGRSLELVGSAADVDGRSDLRRLLRRGCELPRSILRRALAPVSPRVISISPRPRRPLLASPSGLRAPPAPAIA